MKPYFYRFFTGAIGIFLLSSCSSTGVNPTGLMGNQIMCPSGPRAALDCRGVLQQYARDLKADLDAMGKVKLSLGLTTTKLTEADALTSDLLQHSYQTCTLYNACIIPPQEYAAKAEKLQDVQLQVRRALVGGGIAGGQQNIQINPVPGQPFPPPFPGAGVPQPGFPQPGGFPQGGGAPPGFPQASAGAPFDPNVPQQGIAQAQPQQFPGPQPTNQGTSLAMNVPGAPGAQTGDAILSILRAGSSSLRGVSAPATPQTASNPSQPDLDTSLRSMLQSLKQNVATRSASLASGSAVVGNFTEENRPWGSPLGALLQDRVSSIVVNDGVFKKATAVQMRGISVKEVGSVGNANDPKALTSLYNADIAIAGTYQPQGDNVVVKLTAYQKNDTIAQTSQTLPKSVFPDVVAATPQNAPETGQLLNSLNQIGPQADQVVVTTNRPGPGSVFRLGEEIMFFVKSNSDGYVYLFHTDADKNISRIFPNDFQREARVQGGQVLQVPAPGARFKFEASPPFGLETTFAIVTATPLSDADLQAIQSGFGGPNPGVPAFLKTRGIGVVAAGSAAPAAAPVQWNSTTVLVRP